jgi:hypothetical protein
MYSNSLLNKSLWVHYFVPSIDEMNTYIAVFSLTKSVLVLILSELATAEALMT